MDKTSTELRDFLFRGIMFDADAKAFRGAGIRIGMDSEVEESFLLNEVIEPFDIQQRNAALRMSRIYALMYCFENSVREVIADRMLDKHGTDWWSLKVPMKVKECAKTRREAAEHEQWLQGEKTDNLGFVDFGHLTSIIIENWSDFSDLITNQNWLRQRMDELEKVRNFVAHHRLLLPQESQRIEMYVTDWIRQVGV